MSEACFLQQPEGDDAFRKLMSAPVTAKRKRIRKAQVDVGDSVDGSRLSLADLYARSAGGRRAGRSILSRPLPTYRQWLGRFLDPVDADREDARARAEWAAIRSGMFKRETLRRQRQIAKGMLRASADVPAFTAPEIPAAPERKPSRAKSRVSWPSFRARQIAGLVAAGEWQFLADVGLPSIHPGSAPQLLLTVRSADVIALPIPAEATEYREAA